MIIRVSKPCELKMNCAVQVLQAGELLNLPDDKAAKLIEAGYASSIDEDEMSLWRWFVIAANTAFKSFPQTPSSWELHKAHRRDADSFCKVGNIASAKAALEMALSALCNESTPKRRDSMPQHRQLQCADFKAKVS